MKKLLLICLLGVSMLCSVSAQSAFTVSQTNSFAWNASASATNSPYTNLTYNVVVTQTNVTAVQLGVSTNPPVGVPGVVGWGQTVALTVPVGIIIPPITTPGGTYTLWANTIATTGGNTVASVWTGTNFTYTAPVLQPPTNLHGQ